ncbi:pleckstrin-like protein domain-containing family a member 7, partial [Plakobranchus ocellatus]
MASDLLRERLPPGWHLGVTDDGRIFFIDDHRQETSWLHPVTGLPVESGLHSHPDLPPGWEQDTTRDGLVYYIDHNRGITTFEHPLYGYSPQQPPPHSFSENSNQQQQLQPHQNYQSFLGSPNHNSPSAQIPSPAPQSPTSPGGKENFKRGTPKQRSVKAPSAKRNPQAVVVKRGWLHRLESTGISKSKAWKKRWCVLADFALFIYKGEDEQTTLDSILLPSYRINPSTETDNIKRNFVFKVEHENTKTLYLAAEDSPDSVSWMSLLRQAAMMDGNVGFQREQNNNIRQHPHKTAMSNNKNTSLLNQQSPQSPASASPNRHGPYDPRHSYSGQSPSYQGYGDPASSPPYDQHQRPHQQQPQPQHMSPQRQSYTSADDGGFSQHSPDRSFSRHSHAEGYPPSFRGDDSFRRQQPQQPHQHQHHSGRNGDMSSTDPKHFSNPIYHQHPSSPQSSSSSSRPQLLQQQRHSYSQQPRQLRDGFAPDSDSARNSLAQSDSSRGRGSYQPAQAERQRLQQELGGTALSRDPHLSTSNPYYQQQPPYSSGRQGMDSFQRDSYSGDSSADGMSGGHHRQHNHPASHQVVVKQLRPWDTSFPDLEVVTAKQHGSFDDLLDSGNRVGRHSARGIGNTNFGGNSKPTFNARSKSHENFSRLPPEEGPLRMQQQQQQHQQYSPSQQQYSPQQQQQHHPRNIGDTHNASREGRDLHQDFHRPPYSSNFNDMSGQGSSGPSQHPQHHHQQQQHQSPASSSFSSSHHQSPNERPPGYPQPSRNHPHNARDSYASSTNAGPYNHNTSAQHFQGPNQGSSNMNSSFRGSIRGNDDHSYHSRPHSLSSAQGGPSPPSSSRQPSIHRNNHTTDPKVAGTNPHTYVNFPNQAPASASHSSYQGSPQEPHSAGPAPPGRPPYPVAVRRQMVEEMAQVQTPGTQKDFLTAAELNQQRMQQPPFFQYPSPRDQYGNKIPTESTPHNISHASMHSGMSGHQGLPGNLPNSRLSNASRASSSSKRGDFKGGPDSPEGQRQRGGNGGDQGSPHETSFSRTNMMDPEAQKLRMAYERVHCLRMAPHNVENSQNSSSVPSSAQTINKSYYHHAPTSSNQQQQQQRYNYGKLSYAPSHSHYEEDESESMPYQNIQQPSQMRPRKLEQHRMYKSQEELDRVGRTPPPTGTYKRIPDEPVDLYRRGSAFSPPSSQTSGSMQRLDSAANTQKEGKMARSASMDILSDNAFDSHGVSHNNDDDSGQRPRMKSDNSSHLQDDAADSNYMRKQSKAILLRQQNNSRFDQSTGKGSSDQRASQNGGMIVRARLVSVYDNVGAENYPASCTGLSAEASANSNNRLYPARDRRSHHEQMNVYPGSDERDYTHSKGHELGNRRDDDRDDGNEHLFFEPYVNMRDSMVLFPRYANTRTEDHASQGATTSQPFKLAAPPKRKPAPIQTVKEDPNMSDRDVLETNLQKIAKKNPLAGPRLRMSISAGDLIGKTHDELVLLLIQLRRNQAALDKARDYYRTLIERCRPDELEYKRQMHQFGNVQDRRLQHRHQNYVEARAQTEELENKLEVYKPIINLLDNMVTMGSLYGGDNLMLATQYRKHLLRPDQYQPPKKMLEFSRQHQERRLQQETEEEIRQLSSDEVDLEEKIDRLNELDRLLQEQSFKVSSFREDKELLEKALVGVLRQQDQSYHADPREMTRLTNQQRTLEKEISRVTQQLAEASKELEETSAENRKLEHEVALLRTKVHGELSRSRSAPSLSSENIRTKIQMEKELAKVEGMMAGLNQQGQKLQEAMSTIRRSSSSSHLAAVNLDKSDNKAGYSPISPHTTYLQTDLDTGEEVDLAQASSPYINSSDNNTDHLSSGVGSISMPDGATARPVINHQRQVLYEMLVLYKSDNKAGYSPTSPHTTYLQTDLDTGEEVDLAQASSPYINSSDNNTDHLSSGVGSISTPDGATPRPVINHQRQNAGTLDDWDMEGVDENTKRFFGLMPRDKPKGQTLREVKRLSEQRKERDKGRRDGDDSLDGQEIKLRVSNVDNEVSSIIHARIPSDAANRLISRDNLGNGTQYESGLPLYENLPGSKNNTGSNGSNGQNYPYQTARRSSLILMAPKPFTPYQERSSARPFKSELALNVAQTGREAEDNSGSNSVWQPGNGSNSVGDRPYRSVEFLNRPDPSSDSYTNGNLSLHKRAESLYTTDPNNNNNSNVGYTSNGSTYEHEFSSQEQALLNTSVQLQPPEMTQQEPPESAEHITRPVDPTNGASPSRAYTARPWATKGAQFSDDNLFNSRRNSRGRYMTISSSEPIKMEITPTLHSSAGDLILNRS